MPNRSVIFTILLAAIVFGALIAGCNNGKRDKRGRRDGGKRADAGQIRDDRTMAQARTVRPAEVLSASAYRPQPQVEPQLQRQYVVGPAVVEPLPEPIVLAHVPSQPVPATYMAPATYAAPATYEQPWTIATGPELAMARSSLSPMAPPAPRGYRQRLSSAPIPELEPVHRQRMPSVRTSTRPVAEVMMSSGHAPQELQRALAPLGDPTVAQQGWVSSPTITAMRY